MLEIDHLSGDYETGRGDLKALRDITFDLRKGGIVGIRIRIRTDGVVRNKAVVVALAILPDGTQDVLGFGSRQMRVLSSEPRS